ncbi:hypothetical protein HYZ06_01010 [Candidatus Daviesbacteria bacterium]|nr:hypothetical protein [Candidatus Daviesbacteria bacterium]
MDYLKPVDFIQLKAFFKALQENRFNLKQIPSFVVMNGERIPIDKTHCLDLLRQFPDLQGKDDEFITKYLSDPNKIKRLLGNLTLQQQTEITKVLEEKPVEVVGEQPAGAEEVPPPAGPSEQPAGAAGGFPGIGLPSGPSISSYRRPRVIHIVERAKSDLVTATSTGAIREAGDASKLVRATGSGKIVEKPPSKIWVAEKGGVREHAIPRASRFNFPTGIKSFGKNLASRTGVFIKRNLTAMRIGTLASGGIGGIAGASFGPLGALGGGGLGALLPSWIRSGGATRFFGGVGSGAINAGARLSNSASRLSIPGPGKKFLIFGLLVLLILAFLAITSPPSQTTTPSPGGGSTTPVADLSNCKFTRSGNSLPIKSSSLMSWVNNAAAQSGVPAAILASVAMHESANLVANADDNHDAIKSNNYCQEGSTFCEKSGQFSHDGACTGEEIAQGARTAKAVGLMQIIDVYNPGKNLCSLTESLSIAAEKLKSNGITTQPTKDQVTTAINRYYNSCAYGNFSYCEETWQDLQNCQASSAPGTNIIGCPVAAGRITNGSKETGGHCSPSYVQQYGSQGCTVGEAGYTGRDKAVDIVGTFPSVYLPVINGKEVTWNVTEASKTISDAEGGGEDFVATTIAEGKHYRIRFVHLESIPPDLILGSQAQSNKLIGKYYQSNPYGAHVHITIQENGEFKPADTYFNLCQ